MNDRDIATRFLSAVWRLQHLDGYAFLSLKRKDSDWQDISVPVDKETGPMAFDPPNNAKGDIYFTPCLFENSRRLNDLALPSRLLYADLDEVDPRTLALRPTAAWQSSPGRFQALWVLSKRLPPETFSKLNQALTYSTGADRGGWHQSKVLRLPGTRNYKYRGRPNVKLLWFTRQRYAAQSLADALKASPSPSGVSGPLSPADGLPELPSTPPEALVKRHRPKLDARTRRLLRVKTLVGKEDRSRRLWEIENGCLAAGMSPEETLIVARASAYNKYKGQRREARMLWTEIQKAVEKRKKNPPTARADRGAGGGLALGDQPKRGKAAKPKPKKTAGRDVEGSSSAHPVSEGASHRSGRQRRKPTKPDLELSTEDSPIKPLKPVNLLKFLGSGVKSPSWLVESIWGRSAQGIWAGEHKSYKSTLLLDLAVSVASGKPFLERFAVHRQGPVLFIQEENSKGFMHDRAHRIMQSKNLGIKVNGKQRTEILFGPSLNVGLHNLTDFRLTNERDLLALDMWCEINKPALVILDPLYRMAPGINENSQEAMSPILSDLSAISTKHDCALILAHHFNKSNDENKNYRSGHRISGTSVFARWYESAVYVERKGKEGDYTIKFNTEHREHGSLTPQTVTVDLDPLDPDTYAIHLEDDDSPKTQRPGGPERSRPGLSDSTAIRQRFTKPILLRTARRKLGLSSSSLTARLLREEGYRVVRKEIDDQTQSVVLPPRRA